MNKMQNDPVEISVLIPRFLYDWLLEYAGKYPEVTVEQAVLAIVAAYRADKDDEDAA
jgi:hypothetical protein